MGSSLILRGGSSIQKTLSESIAQAHSFSVGNVLRYNLTTSSYVLAQANSAENSEVIGVVSAVNSTVGFTIVYSGYIELSGLASIAAPVLFLSGTTAGAVSVTPPSAIGSVIKPVLSKNTNGSGYVVINYLGTPVSYTHLTLPTKRIV